MNKRLKNLSKYKRNKSCKKSICIIINELRVFDAKNVVPPVLLFRI